MQTKEYTIPELDKKLEQDLFIMTKLEILCYTILCCITSALTTWAFIIATGGF